MSYPTWTERVTLCRNRKAVGLHSVKHDMSNGNEKRWITQGNGLHRYRIRQVSL